MHNWLILTSKRRTGNRRNGTIFRLQVPGNELACRCGVTLNARNRGTAEICTCCEGVRGPGVSRTHGMQTSGMARGRISMRGGDAGLLILGRDGVSEVEGG